MRSASNNEFIKSFKVMPYFDFKYASGDPLPRASQKLGSVAISVNVLFAAAAAAAEINVIPTATKPTPGTITPAALAITDIQPPTFANQAIVGALIETPGIAVTADPSPLASAKALAPDCVAMANCPVIAPATGFIFPTAKFMAETHLFMVEIWSVFLFGVQFM
ncbi:MAG: hypothetical protein KGZ68_06365 [Dechloromonas sp.]|nr:hypothetical protein [Dechloromonas sp.]